MDKEIYRVMYPTGIASFSFRFSDRALQWLCGTTTDDNGREIGNFALFGDLLARMTLTDGVASGFHRPLMLSAGQAQYSEELLSSQWDMGLIDTRRSRVASVMTFPCLLGWETTENGSKSSVWLHEESKSGIPHLHAIVCRVDEDGNINNDHAIHLRAQRAAEKVARQRGWTTAMHIHETNITQVSADCMEALRELDKWSWDGYKERLAAKGYELHLRKDKKDMIRGYVLCKGNTRFKASELGKGRNLTASRIRQTWEKLHPEQDKQKTKQASPTPKPTATPTPKPTVPNTAKQKSQPVIRQSNPVYEDYTEYKSNRLPTEFEHDGKTYKRYLPGKVLDFFNDEFDYQELTNWQDLQNLAMAYFTLIASPYEVTSGGGGGGSQSDLKWGRDPEEDEIESARRCAREASHRLGIQKKSGMKRK